MQLELLVGRNGSLILSYGDVLTFETPESLYNTG